MVIAEGAPKACAACWLNCVQVSVYFIIFSFLKSVFSLFQIIRKEHTFHYLKLTLGEPKPAQWMINQSPEWNKITLFFSRKFYLVWI